MSQYQYILSYAGNSETLTIAPAGWDKIGINLVRHEVYHSILRNFTLSLRFVKKLGGGGQFIIDAYETEGIAANILITINRRNKSTNVFELFYSGTIDLKTLSNNRDFIEAGIMDGMKLQKLISRDEISFDLLKTVSADNISVLDFANQKSIALTPINIILSAALTAEYDYENEMIIVGGEGANYPDIKNPIYTLNEIGNRVNFDNTSTIYTNTTTSDVNIRFRMLGNFRRYGDVIYSGITAIDAIVHVAFGVNSFDGNIVVIDAKTVFSEDYYGLEYSYDKTTYVDFDELYIIPPGGIINLYMAVEAYHVNSVHHTVKSSLNFELTEYSVGKVQTNTRCIFPHEAFTRLVQLTTSEQDTAKLFNSEFFGRTESEFTTYPDDGTGSKDAIFTGYMVRNYPNVTLNVTLRDLFKTFDAIYNLGMGYDRVNDRFYIEQKSRFFKSDYFMFDLGEVADLKITPSMKHYFSKVTGGYENEGSYNDYQGAYEFNVKREYSLSTPVKDEKNIQSKYRLDSIGVELARRKQYIDNASLDTDYDKEVFIVRTDKTKPVLSTTVTGFPGIDMYYNTMLSPRQNALRHGNILRPALYKNGNPVKFQNSGKTVSMAYGSVNEFSDIQQIEIDTALFKPELYDLKSYINSTILAVLNNDPHGYFRFTNKGKVYEAFLVNLESGDYNKDCIYKGIAKEVSNNDYLLFEDNTEMLFENETNILSE